MTIIKEKKTKRINVRAFPHMVERLNILSKHFGCSNADIIHMAINDLCLKEGLFENKDILHMAFKVDINNMLEGEK